MSFGQTPVVTFNPRSQNLSEANMEPIIVGKPGRGKSIDLSGAPAYDVTRKLLEAEEGKKVLDQVQRLSRDAKRTPQKPNRTQRRNTNR